MTTQERPEESGMPGDASPHTLTGKNEAELIPESGSADPAPDIAALLKKAEDEAADLKDAWLRARADTENVRKQAAKDVARAHKFAIENFARDLLPVKDALEAALATGAAAPDALKSGVELTLKQLDAAFEKAQIAAVDPVGARFDPNVHQAMTTVEADAPANTVALVFQKGYVLNDRVLRPAMVAVVRPKGAE
jgi:molecular chaperone GrpE